MGELKKISDRTSENPGKTQKSLMIWENIKMVITGLKIKTKKVITLVNI